MYIKNGQVKNAHQVRALYPQVSFPESADAAFAELGWLPYTPPPPTPEEEAAKAERAAQFADMMASTNLAKADPVLQFLRDHTPAECEAYVQTNVTDLASAKQLMKKFAFALCVLAKRNFR